MSNPTHKHAVIKARQLDILTALKGVISHNNAVKFNHKLPASLIKQVNLALGLHENNVIEHARGMRYNIWTVDMDGNENHFTAQMTETEAATLGKKLWQLKQEEVLSDSVVTTDNDLSFTDAIDEINEWLSNTGKDARIKI